MKTTKIPVIPVTKTTVKTPEINQDKNKNNRNKKDQITNNRNNKDKNRRNHSDAGPDVALARLQAGASESGSSATRRCDAALGTSLGGGTCSARKVMQGLLLLFR